MDSDPRIRVYSQLRPEVDRDLFMQALLLLADDLRNHNPEMDNRYDVIDDDQ